MKKILVTKPLLPDIKLFTTKIKSIWDSEILTNRGDFHKELEDKLKNFLHVKNFLLYTNGTIPLFAALKVLNLKGEIITTPFTFPATAHQILLNGLNPVFIDIDEKTCNIDVKKIENYITDKTSAILAVHVYGNPCDVYALDAIAKKHNIKIIYDAAHAFSVEIDNRSILNYGDISTLSFHATKIFNTAEGGAAISNNDTINERLKNFRNFGITGEDTVDSIGLNAKLDEFRSCLGLLNLDIVDKAIEKRKRISNTYDSLLSNIEGIRYLSFNNNVKRNYSYYPIFIDKDIFGKSRDEVYNYLKDNCVYTRKYFYPLLTTLPIYSKYKGSSRDELRNAIKISSEVLCLPLYPHMQIEDVYYIVDLIKKFNCQKYKI